MLIGYARVSTTDQDPAMQVDALEAAGCERILTETASGANRGRPELARALDVTRAGDVLVVWKLDRLARSTSQLIATMEMLNERGVDLRSLTEAIDTTTAGGKLVFTVFAAIAEFERNIISERTREGLKAARARGARPGRPRQISERDLDKARRLIRQGVPMADVATVIGCSRSRLYTYFPGGKSGIS